jgi:hypothetical protein
MGRAILLWWDEGGAHHLMVQHIAWDIQKNRTFAA